MLVLHEKWEVEGKNWGGGVQFSDNLPNMKKNFAGGQRNFATICENYFFIMG